jgi:hypothetical protein
VPHRGDSHGGRNEHHGVQIMVRGGTHSIGWPKVERIKVFLDTFVTISPQIVTLPEIEGDGFLDYCVGQIKRTGSVLRLGPEGNSTRRKYSLNALVYVVTY